MMDGTLLLVPDTPVLADTLATQPREGDRPLCTWSSSPPGAPCGSGARCPRGDLLQENPALPFPGSLLHCPEDAPGFTFQENHIKGRKEGNPHVASLRVHGRDRPPSASGKMQMMLCVLFP
ncbi:unnamed protein product [Rangifer tarandus platyrhynchus]|uniref:Uncharacterized protein n=2 Tax=Rangifer tarandus platyrhynchus TaxID=3082113 RepID=A0AC59Y844_RANTA|nr:unnamed protein product [Rangifer tarandus platyrhynchus]